MNTISEPNSKAKNQIQEIVTSLGWPDYYVQYDSKFLGPRNWESKVTIPKVFPGVSGTGKGSRRSEADVKAAEMVLPQLPDVKSEWSRSMRDAQAGDALIKLAAYTAEVTISAYGASLWLQLFENDNVLAANFDRWKAEGIEEFRAYGPNLGTNLKATLVETLVWRRFGPRVLTPGAAEALKEIVYLVAQWDRSSADPK